MTELLKRRMKSRHLEPHMVAKLMRVHREKCIAFGGEDELNVTGESLMPRAFGRSVVVDCLNAKTHKDESAIVDAIDSILTPLRPQRPTMTEVGTNERIEVYARRFERGEALFHECDSKVCHPLNQEKERIV
jgi:hypothetical protein